MKNVAVQLLVFVAVLFFNLCYEDSGIKQNKSKIKTVSINALRQHDEAYMHTGFYFLADNDVEGVEMLKEESRERYNLKRLPFAAVANVRQTEFKTTKLENGDYTDLCLTFDEIGTKDLELGTGNILHSKIAIVLAGKLLYVVDNTTKIKTGIMCVGLIDYTPDEMAKIKAAVDQKN